MNIFPALRFHMGSWDYYVVKMGVRELSEGDETFAEWIGTGL